MRVCVSAGIRVTRTHTHAYSIYAVPLTYRHLYFLFGFFRRTFLSYSGFRVLSGLYNYVLIIGVDSIPRMVHARNLYRVFNCIETRTSEYQIRARTRFAFERTRALETFALRNFRRDDFYRNVVFA